MSRTCAPHWVRLREGAYAFTLFGKRKEAKHNAVSENGYVCKENDPRPRRFVYDAAISGAVVSYVAMSLVAAEPGIRAWSSRKRCLFAKLVIIYRKREKV